MKHDIYSGEKLLMVQPVTPGLKPAGTAVIGLDKAQAGAGDLVLYLDEGNSARTILEDNMAPARTVIVGIVDEVDYPAGRKK